MLLDCNHPPVEERMGGQTEECIHSKASSNNAAGSIGAVGLGTKRNGEGVDQHANRATIITFVALHCSM